jgi:signal transduction histidine kinase
MASRLRSALAAEAARAAAPLPAYPFRGPGIWARTIPFAAIAVVAEISLALPPGPRSRRAVLWAALGTLIVIATHGLRDRIARSQEETGRLQAHLRQVSVVQDRERIAAGIQNTVIQRLFAVGLNLQGAAAQIAEPAGRERVESAVSELDQVIAAIRDSIFARERTAADNKGLRAEIMELFTQIGPASHVRFSGPVDESLQPQVREEFLRVLREALGIIQPHYAIARVEVTAGHDSFAAAIEASPSGGPHQGLVGFDAQRLRHGAAEAGTSVDVATEPAAARVAWVIPLN